MSTQYANMNVMELDDIEFVDTDRVYIRVCQNFDVRIVKTDEGIVIDVFPWDKDSDSLGSTYVFDNEVIDVLE